MPIPGPFDPSEAVKLDHDVFALVHRLKYHADYKEAQAFNQVLLERLRVGDLIQTSDTPSGWWMASTEVPGSPHTGGVCVARCAPTYGLWATGAGVADGENSHSAARRLLRAMLLLRLQDRVREDTRLLRQLRVPYAPFTP